MSSREVKLDLPDNLAREAEANGLLTSEAIESLLRAEIRSLRVNKLFDAADRLAALGAPPLTETEVEAEIAAVRRERRGNDVLNKPEHEQKKSKEQQATAKSKRRFTVALLFASIFIVSITLLIIYKSLTPGAVDSLFLYVMAIVSAIGMFSTINLSRVLTIHLTWRSDRRDAREKELKIVQLERELEASSEKLALPIPKDEKNRK